MKQVDLFTQYELPPKSCTHAICDGEICILNPVHLRAVLEWKYVSCLQVPMLGGFKRMKKMKKVSKGTRPKMVVFYMKNDKGKFVRLWNYEDIFNFMQKHCITLTIDLFSFNPKIDCQLTLDKKLWWKKCMVEDVSNGKEMLQIPAVNLVDDEVPVIDEYVITSLFARDRTVYKRTHTCCDCIDNCKDKLKCACFQETLKCYNPDERRMLRKDENIGYDFKRLPFARQNLSGIYECNSKCHCNDQCLNRVVQFPPKWKVQLYKDEIIKEKGWGVRTLNDIPAGSFVGVYTGIMSQESKANLMCDSAEWLTAGKWKYIVNLQVMQNASKEAVKFKPAVEGRNTKSNKVADVNHIPKLSIGHLNLLKIYEIPKHLIADKNLTHPTPSQVDSRIEELLTSTAVNCEHFKEILSHKRKAIVIKKEQLASNIKTSQSADNKSKKVRQFVTYAAEDSIYKIPANLRFNQVPKRKLLVPKKKQGTAVSPLISGPATVVPKSEESVPKEFLPSVKISDILKEVKKFKVDPFKDDNDENKPFKLNSNKELESTPTDVALTTKPKIGRGRKTKPVEQLQAVGSRKRAQSPAVAGGSKAGKVLSKVPRLALSPPRTSKASECEGVDPQQLAVSPQKKTVPCMSPRKLMPGSPTKKTMLKGKYSLRRGNEGKNYTYKQYDDMLKDIKYQKVQPKIRVSKDLYLVDGRKKGNIGRYLNHSCDPNVFCQYVFVETHDVRFPVVAFFAIKDIKAGTELTWSYNYDDDTDMGIDPLECKCGAGDKCRGILIC